MTEPKERIIVALDNMDSLAKITPYIERLGPFVGYFKVGLELATAVGAPQAVQHVLRLGGKLFFDGKFHDIPNTVAGATRSIASLGVDFFTVHASSGLEALKASAEAKQSSKLLAVTVLTSLNEEEALQIYGRNVEDKVVEFATLAQTAGADGIVCSAKELEVLSRHSELAKLIKVTPGVRPTWAEALDQKRVLTPREAIQLGASHLVIGRPIINPPRGIGSPIDAIRAILDEISDLPAA